MTIEVGFTGDDGTTRDTVARVLHLATIRDGRLRVGKPSFEVADCMGGRGLGVCRQDIRDTIKGLHGQVFTTLHNEHPV